MPSLTMKLASLKHQTRTFTLLRRNPDHLHAPLSPPPTTALRSLIPKITHALRPHPRLRLLAHPAASPTSPTLPLLDVTSVAADEPSSPLPPSAVPWPPQVCAAPLSTHHRLRCGHTVRTPFLSPCAANCAHVPRGAGSGALPPFVLGEFGCPACVREGVAVGARGEGRGCEMAERRDGHGVWCP